MCFSFCTIIYSFVCQYFLRYYCNCYNQKHLFGDAVLQKRCSYKFRKIHKKTPKKRFQHRCFLENSTKFFISIFLNSTSVACFSINTRSVYCPTITFRFFKNEVTYISWLSIFFGLICRLGTRMSLIFQALSQKPVIQSKIVNSLKPLSIFAKNVP